MKNRRAPSVTCAVCNGTFKPNECLPGELVSNQVAALVRQDHPDWSGEGYICLNDLQRYRSEYLRDLLEKEKGELSALEEEVLQTVKDQELVTEESLVEFDETLTFGERLADHMASFGGSWRFIGIFTFVLLAWIGINSAVLLWKPFDPYPFILLNLVLSCLAAVQAPIIMMSQNRLEDRDRLRAENDYQVNLKAELEIRMLNRRLDHLLVNQWQRLLEIQELQVELMNEARSHYARNEKPSPPSGPATSPPGPQKP